VAVATVENNESFILSPPFIRHSSHSFVSSTRRR